MSTHCRRSNFIYPSIADADVGSNFASGVELCFVRDAVYGPNQNNLTYFVVETCSISLTKSKTKLPAGRNPEIAMKLLCIFFLLTHPAAICGKHSRQLNLDDTEAKHIDTEIRQILDDVKEVREEVDAYFDDAVTDEEDVEEDVPPIDGPKVQNVDMGPRRSGLFWKKGVGAYPSKMMLSGRDTHQKKSYKGLPPSSLTSNLFFDVDADVHDDIQSDAHKKHRHHDFQEKKALKGAPPNSRHSGLFFDAENNRKKEISDGEVNNHHKHPY